MELKDYKNVFVFAEQREGNIQSVAFELLGKARDLADALGEKVVAMLLGYKVKDQAQKLIEFGADEVIVADVPELKDYPNNNRKDNIGVKHIASRSAFLIGLFSFVQNIYKPKLTEGAINIVLWRYLGRV